MTTSLTDITLALVGVSLVGAVILGGSALHQQQKAITENNIRRSEDYRMCLEQQKRMIDDKKYFNLPTCYR